MATPILCEKFNTGDDDATMAISGLIILGQTFTVSIPFNITGIRLKLYGLSNLPYYHPGMVTVRIYATNESGFPTGDILVSGTTDGDTLTEDTNGEWREISLSPNPILSADAKYAIVISPEDGRLYWRRDTDSGYANGQAIVGTISGETWGAWANDGTPGVNDNVFEVYGVPLCTQYEYYDYGNKEYYSTIYGNTYISAQTFKPQISHKIMHVDMLIRKKIYGGTPGTIIVEIRTTEGGVPTEIVLCSGTTDGNTLTIAPAGEWRYVIFSSFANLIKDIEYAIVMRAPDAINTDYVEWIANMAGTVYERGTAIRKTGGDWESMSPDDFWFKEYGLMIPTIIDQSKDTNIELGKQVEFFVDAEGDPIPTYQWYQDNISISGEINDTISFYVESSGIYKCKVSNEVGDVWSDPIVLTVIGNPYTYRLFDLFIDADRED